MNDPVREPSLPQAVAPPGPPPFTIAAVAAAPAPPTMYDGNQQEVGSGLAVLGNTGDIHYHHHTNSSSVDEQVAKPRFREGPYPPKEVAERLRGFVDPPTYASCRLLLTDRQVLLMVGEPESGTSTTSLALLHDVTRGGRITGLEPSTDLTEWSPSATGGYLLQGIEPGAGGLLDEVALNRLTDQLDKANAYLVVIVDRTARLPRALEPWCRRHIPPTPGEVARARLSRMAEDSVLSKDQTAHAIAALEQAPFKEYLAASQSPSAGVEVSEELWEVVANGRTRDAAADNLRLGSTEAAENLLATVRGSLDDLALTATIALLEEQDRSVVERFAAQLRRRLASAPERDAAEPGRDLLGRGIKERLDAVQARLQPRTVSSARGHRYWIQPVSFRGKHLAEEVLQRLWLDYEGFADILVSWMLDLPHEPGVDRIAGHRIGRVLCQASGPNVLRQLHKFADSPLEWQRRLAGYALGEVVQDVVLSGAVRTQLRQWSQQAAPEVRSTVAETCAGSLGLALPEFSLSLLNSVLSGAETRLDEKVRKAVGSALGVLLTEDANRGPVLGQLATWLGEEEGTARRVFAIRSVEALCRNGFPAVNRAGIRRLTLTDLYAGPWEQLVPLVLEALDDKVLQRTMQAALIELEGSSPEGRQRMDSFVTSLTDASGGHHGLRIFLFDRYRDTRSAALETEPQ